MTPAEERRFIRLWNQEASYREIAQALGCALGTVGSRASVGEDPGPAQGWSLPHAATTGRPPRGVT
jgi:hypothetical protein